MAQPGKIHNATQKRKRMKIDILGISKMRWPRAIYCDINKHRMSYLETSNNEYKHGVSMIAECVTNFVPVLECCSS